MNYEDNMNTPSIGLMNSEQDYRTWQRAQLDQRDKITDDMTIAEIQELLDED